MKLIIEKLARLRARIATLRPRTGDLGLTAAVDDLISLAGDAGVAGQKQASIQVKSCSDCPFIYSPDLGRNDKCGHPGPTKGYGILTNSLPEWCPLRKAGAVFTVER